MEAWSIVILPYMINDMKLSGNELIVYAFVNGFCGANGHGWQGTLDSVAAHTGMAKKTVQRALLALEAQKFIKKCKCTRVIDTEYGVITNSLPLYIAVYGKNEKDTLTVDQADVVNNDQGIQPFVEGPKPELKPDQKAAGDKKADSPFSKAKNYFLDSVNSLYQQGKLATNITSVNSGRINKRLKELFARGVTPAQMNLTFQAMAQDDFCVQQLNFELAPLLSDSMFFKFYKIAAEKYKVEKRQKTISKIQKKCYCGKCGRELFNGVCGYCDGNNIIANIG